ncbi:MAG: hypothetical protein QGG40_04380, partial [Myxococcota bacterium]|nr:hypothetical protein [Myxococcota bacterium]
MEEAREALAHLLVQIENTDSTDARIEAMEFANRLALRFGDPNLADVAEALSVDLDDLTDHQEFQVQVQRSLARATRRAIALAHRQGASTPSELLEWLTAEPQVIAQEIHRHLDSDQRGLAQAILEV